MACELGGVQKEQRTSRLCGQIRAHSGSLSLAVGSPTHPKKHRHRAMGTGEGKRGQQVGTDLPARSDGPGVPAHGNQQRQLGFAKFGLAPPEKRREPVKERRARFLERGSLELGKGNAMNSAEEVNI